MAPRLKVVLMVVACVAILMGQGCAVIQQPPAVTGGQRGMADDERPFPHTRPIHAKAGLYVNDQLKKYVYRGQLGDQTFRINGGELLMTISRRMVSAVFQEAVLVETLPPKVGGYEHDIGAVVEPEIIYFGVASGAPQVGPSGPLEVRVILRVTIYDLRGNVLWQDETSGEGTGRPDDPSRGNGGLQGNMERMGYRALFAAAARIIHDLNAQPPGTLYRTFEPTKPSGPKNRAGTSDGALAKVYRKTGKAEWDRKNHQQARYWFKRAESISPGDALTRFYGAVCSAYIGQRTEALDQFTRIIRENPGTQLSRDSAKWVETIRNPLKLGVVVIDQAQEGGKRILPAENTVVHSIKKCGAYEVVGLANQTPPLNPKDRKGFNEFLDRCSRKGLTIVLYVYTEGLGRKVLYKGPPTGDAAEELSTLVSAYVFSAKKRKLHSQVSVRERIAVLGDRTLEEKEAIRTDLVSRASERLVLALLEKDII